MALIFDSKHRNRSGTDAQPVIQYQAAIIVLCCPLRYEKTMRILLGVASSVLLSGFADACPTFWRCDAGIDAILKPESLYGNNSQFDMGSLSDTGITVTLNDEVLMPDKPTDFATMEDFNLTITSSNGTFTGFLARIEGSGEDPFLVTTAALAPGDDQSKLALATCVTVDRVGGVTQEDSEDKTTVPIVLRMDVPANGLLLDITVGYCSSGTDDLTAWSYSRFELNAVAPPSMAPTTRFPPTMPSPTPAEGGSTEPTSDAATIGMVVVATVSCIGAFVFMI